VQYLGWAVQHLRSSEFAGMLDRADAALGHLGDALHAIEPAERRARGPELVSAHAISDRMPLVRVAPYCPHPRGEPSRPHSRA
jgi:hypothetical protein